MKDPAFLFYPNDWLGGCTGWTFEIQGAYLNLLIMQFNRGKFTEALAKHMLSTCFDYAWPMLKEKFITDGTYYWNERLNVEIERRKKFTESRRLNALGTKEEKALAKHMPVHMETEIETVIENKKVTKYTEDFETFWKIYPRKEGKIAAFKKWKIAPDRPVISEIVSKIEAQKKTDQWQDQGGKFIPLPETYISKGYWFNEIKAKKLVVQL